METSCLLEFDIKVQYICGAGRKLAPDRQLRTTFTPGPAIMELKAPKSFLRAIQQIQLYLLMQFDSPMHAVPLGHDIFAAEVDLDPGQGGGGRVY